MKYKNEHCNTEWKMCVCFVHRLINMYVPKQKFNQLKQ